MGMTMTQKILARHAGVDEIKAGDLIICEMDWAMTNDLMGVQTFQEFEKIGKTEVFDKEKVIIIPDHFTPNNDIKSAELTKKLREFARKYEITNYFEIGRMGIEHAFLPEQGFVAPGEVIIGADSHTCTYGALNAFSTGVGLTDLGASLVTGTTWLKVPSAIKVELVGNLPKYVKGKDVILTLIGMIGVDGARYQSLEFTGNIGALSIDDRFTICNMAIEAGAKNGIFPVDDITTDYLKGRVQRDYQTVTPDADAEYERTVVIELDKLTPVVAYPHLPENIKPADQFKDINIDQVVIGSCTNGRISDLAQAAEILQGHKIHDNVRVIIFPATQDIYMEAFEKGYMKIFVDAGAVVSTPMCGPCLGGHNGVLAAGERALATTNRNFRGRMGHVESEVYLSGPYVAAASAIMGRIAVPEEIS